MLELKIRAQETCEGFTLTDCTGTYNASTNPTGYGGFNGVLDPFDLDAYSLEVRYPNVEQTDPASYTYDLKTLPTPLPDANGYYTWAFTKTMLGVATITSGVYNFTVIGVKGVATYMADAQNIFVNDIQSVIDKKMLGWDPLCECKDGCENPADLFVELVTVKCGGVCDADKAQDIIEELYNKSKLCC